MLVEPVPVVPEPVEPVPVVSSGGSTNEGGASLPESAEVLPESLKLKSIHGGSFGPGFAGQAASAAKTVSAEALKMLRVMAESASRWRAFLFDLFIFDFLL